MLSAKFEQDPRFQREVENLKEEVAVLKARLAELEQKNLRSPVLLQKLGEFFGFGAAGKLDWARFKFNFKREQLDQLEAHPEMLKVTAKSQQAGHRSDSSNQVIVPILVVERNRSIVRKSVKIPVLEGSQGTIGTMS
jgi:hypothetical protein